ncbi:MAG: tRNA uridine-5-carboxymethylaminomethyl(34) synthesis GTPase MnmE [Gammaproteobacteria bacterium]|jgi:tRNA modification GTPase
MPDFRADDTIVARGTPPGRGGIAVIRVSGSATRQIAEQFLGTLPEPRRATLSAFGGGDGEAIDHGIALFFPGPHSFTGEDTLELQAHGSPVVVDMLIERLCELGARIAEAGEFSRRAFMNDKLDLTQAEAIADLIDSSSRKAARAAQRSMQGRFSEMVMALNEHVTTLRVHVEAALDFPEEEIDFLSDDALRVRLDATRTIFDDVERAVRQGCLLREGVTVVLAGRPNAGKSSLLNVLAGYDAAIVTHIAGTTRDLVREQIELSGLPVNIIDTAGLRASADEVEEEGIKRARAELDNADHALVIYDAVTGTPTELRSLLAELPALPGYTIVRNKIDLTDIPAGRDSTEPSMINVSAKTGAGIDDLRSHLERQLGYEPAGEGTVIARQRHLESLRRARAHFDAACEVLEATAAGELMAEELLQVQNALAEITGQFSSDDLLGEIFSSFCIGK